MSEYINREDALDAVLFALVGTGHQSRAIYAIRELPTADVVEVVRCKDCAYCRYVDDADIYKCDRRGFYSEEVMPTDYCNLGERREE